MRNFLFLPTGSLLASLLFSSCSHPSNTATTDSTADVVTTPAARTAGTVADSLDGVPSHHFGDALASFPGLVKSENASLDGMDSYYYPTGNAHELAWFAKHAAEVPTVLYFFQNGKFAKFNAAAYTPVGKDALAREAKFLFGPGQESVDRTEWVGKKAWAVLAPNFVNGQQIKVLVVNSVTLQNQQEAAEQARLKTDNAP